MAEFIIDERGNKPSKAYPIKYIINENNCWECISHPESRKGQGYRKIGRNGKATFVHRYVYTLYYGEIPDGLIVRHKCNNRKCCNPEHLEIGTNKDNTRDMFERNRSGRLGKTIVTEEMAFKIKEKLLENTSYGFMEKYKKIALEFSLRPEMIRNIKTGNHVVNRIYLNGGYKDWIQENDNYGR
jgi:hypothetical protein